MIGRLRSGVTLEQAQAQADASSADLRSKYTLKKRRIITCAWSR